MSDRGQFTSAQRETLLKPIMPGRVNKDNKGMSYVEGYEIQAHLNRIFGFEGWDKEILLLEPIYESMETEKRYWVAYKCMVRLRVYADGVLAKLTEEVGTGQAQNQPNRADAHDLAMKSAVTDALKRCAKDLGDQFGLSLYNKGSMEPLVKRVIPYE
jgi:recombination DNA repair RAD52 pathway protein